MVDFFVCEKIFQQKGMNEKDRLRLAIRMEKAIHINKNEEHELLFLIISG